jgi:hypothetical protein
VTTGQIVPPVLDEMLNDEGEATSQRVMQAIAVAAQWPSARLGSIEVRPIEPELRGRESRYL